MNASPSTIKKVGRLFRHISGETIVEANQVDSHLNHAKPDRASRARSAISSQLVGKRKQPFTATRLCDKNHWRPSLPVWRMFQRPPSSAKTSSTIFPDDFKYHTIFQFHCAGRYASLRIQFESEDLHGLKILSLPARLLDAWQLTSQGV